MNFKRCCMRIRRIGINQMNYKKYIKNTNLIKDKPVLFCFPYAGGGASAYSGWIRALEDEITVCPVQLPGREDRLMEPFHTDMKEVVNEITEIIQSLITCETFLFGHSMGAKIAFEVARKLEKRGGSIKRLFVSGSRVPHKPPLNPIYNLPKDQFLKELQRFEGTPEEILGNEELLNFFLPLLRADFTMDETYHMEQGNPLKCPITAFGGEEDKEAKPAEIDLWRQYTEVFFSSYVFQGGHFFVKTQEENIIKEVKNIIKNHDSLVKSAYE